MIETPCLPSAVGWCRWANGALALDRLLIAALASTSRTWLEMPARVLWDRDEPRYAVAVREMRSRGDWIFPTFNDQPRYHKPILIYWLMGLSTAIAGNSPFGAVTTGLRSRWLGHVRAHLGHWPPHVGTAQVSWPA